MWPVLISVVKSDLKGQMGTHIRKTPYSCERCESAFLRKSLLVRHMQTYTREKRYCCEGCGSAFPEKSNLVDHM